MVLEPSRTFTAVSRTETLRSVYVSMDSCSDITLPFCFAWQVTQMNQAKSSLEELGTKGDFKRSASVFRVRSSLCTQTQSRTRPTRDTQGLSVLPLPTPWLQPLFGAFVAPPS